MWTAGENILWIASQACFFVATGCLMGLDKSQSSYKTMVLLAIAYLISPPFYKPTFWDWLWFGIWGVIWVWLLYSYFKVDSALRVSYNPELDSFPFWYLLTLPAIGMAVLFYVLPNERDGLAYCVGDFEGLEVYCIQAFLWTGRASLVALAFLPQSYLNIKVWKLAENPSPDDQQEGNNATSGTLNFKIKLFTILMVASFSLSALEILLSDVNADFTGVFVGLDLLTIFVLLFPWIYRSTCMGSKADCCICIGRNQKSDDENDASPDAPKKSWFGRSSRNKETDDNDIEEPTSIQGPSIQVNSNAESSSPQHAVDASYSVSGNTTSERPDWLT